MERQLNTVRPERSFVSTTLHHGLHDGHLPPVVYILSSVRSGSTMLKAMLNKHSRIFAPAELHILPFADLIDAERMYRRTMMNRGIYEAVAALLGSERAAEALVDRFKDERTLVADIYDWFRETLDGRYLVDKSPTYLLDTEILKRAEKMGAERHSPPLYIFLRRHPFDILDSSMNCDFDKLFRVLDLNDARIRRGPEKGHDSVWSSPLISSEDLACKTSLDICESTYIKTMRTALGFLNGIPAERQLHIAYESVISEPQEAMRSICDFLSLDFEAAMLNPYENRQQGDRGPGETVGDPNFHKHRKLSQEFRMKWMQHKDEWEKQPLLLGTALLSRELGYPLQNHRLKSVMTPSQQCFIKQHGGDALVIEFACTLTPGDAPLDRVQLQRCLAVLTERHPELGMFHTADEPTMMQIETVATETAIRFRDLARADGKAQGESIAEGVRRALAEIAVARAPMFRILIDRIESRRYRISYLFHHLIADGYAIQNFHRELWRLYSAPEPAWRRQGPMQILNRDAGFLLSSCRQYMDAGNEKAFWLEALGCPGAWSEAKLQHLTENRVASMRSRRFDVGKRSDKRHYFPAALAWYHTLAELDGSKTPVIAHRLHRRHLSGVYNLKEQLGWLAGDAPIPLAVNRSLVQQQHNLRKALATLPMGGLSYDWLYLRDELPALHEKCVIRFNYYPLIFSAGKQDTFDISDVDIRLHQPEDGMRDFLLDIIMREYPGNCQLEIRYSTHAHSDAEIEALYETWLGYFVDLAGIEGVTP